VGEILVTIFNFGLKRKTDVFGSWSSSDRSRHVSLYDWPVRDRLPKYRLETYESANLMKLGGRVRLPRRPPFFLVFLAEAHAVEQYKYMYLSI